MLVLLLVGCRNWGLGIGDWGAGEQGSRGAGEQGRKILILSLLLLLHCHLSPVTCHLSPVTFFLPLNKSLTIH